MPRPRADAPPVEAFVAMEVGKAKALLRTVDASLSTLTLTLNPKPNPQPSTLTLNPHLNYLLNYN